MMEEESKDQFLKIPHEVILLIFNFLDVHSLINSIPLVCSSWRFFSFEESIWRANYLRRYGNGDFALHFVSSWRTLGLNRYFVERKLYQVYQLEGGWNPSLYGFTQRDFENSVPFDYSIENFGGFQPVDDFYHRRHPTYHVYFDWATKLHRIAFALHSKQSDKETVLNSMKEKARMHRIERLIEERERDPNAFGEITNLVNNRIAEEVDEEITQIDSTKEFAVLKEYSNESDEDDDTDDDEYENDDDEEDVEERSILEAIRPTLNERTLESIQNSLSEGINPVQLLLLQQPQRNETDVDQIQRSYDLRTSSQVKDLEGKIEKEFVKLSKRFSSNELFAVAYDLFETTVNRCCSEIGLKLPTFSSQHPNSSKSKGEDLLSFRWKERERYTDEELKDRIYDLITVITPFGRSLLFHADRSPLEKSEHLFKKAITTLESAIIVDPSNDFLYIDLADANGELAKITFSTIQSKNSQKNPEIRDTILWRKRGVETVQKLLNYALKMFECAHDINKQDHICLGSWAISLVDLAELCQYIGNDDEADIYYERAAQTYEKACNIQPYDFLADWSRALYERAKMKEGETSINLLRDSIEKIERTLSMVDEANLGFGKSVYLKNWADSQCEISLQTIDYYESNLEHEKAVNKYSESLKEAEAETGRSIDRSSIFNSWGNCYYDFAKKKQRREEAKNLLELSVEKYVQGLAIRPNDDSIQFNIGDALVELAKMEDDEEKMDQYFEVARSRYALSCIDSITLNNWGFAFLENGILRKDPRRKLDMLLEAEKKFQDALSVESDYYTSIANLGNVKRERAKISEKESEKTEFFNQSIALFEKSLSLQPRHFKAMVYWAQALVEQTQLLSLPNPKSYLEKAEELCLDALKIKSNYHLAAFTLIEVYHFSGDVPNREKWLDITKKWAGYSNVEECFRYRRLTVRCCFSYFEGNVPKKFE
eukprot:TRINITY_DN6261_c0_g1_i1.p1 TRINITY_DN6261_c0_g1~~TRINITY_DN6261_c0_g1_i1.p1  ORF type:complete len:943 (-),score=305.79 TRINITY_DN6261_c0_g1_i1:33-2861(-)